MGSPRLNLSFNGVACPEARVLRVVQGLLRDNPALASISTKVRAWEGDDQGAGLPVDDVEPAPADLPLIKLRPASNMARWETENQHRAAFAIDVMVYVPGTHANDLLNFWHAIRLAILPPSGTPERIAAEALFLPITQLINHRPGFTQQPATVTLIGEAKYAQKATGSIVFGLLIDT